MSLDRLYEFGPFRLDAGGRLLFREGQRMALSPKAVELRTGGGGSEYGRQRGTAKQGVTFIGPPYFGQSQRLLDLRDNPGGEPAMTALMAAATSTDDLMCVMEVGRQSMYDTFGDKRALFLKALELYVTESVHSIDVELRRPGSAVAAVQNALVTFAQRKDLSSVEGRMGLNAISEFGQRDADVTRITRNAARALHQTLVRVLTRAKKQGEIRPDADLDSMADFFESTLAGIRMAAKAGKSRQTLRNIAVFASRAYMASDRRITPE